MTTVVRRLPGPFATRTCTASDGTFAWHEDRSTGLTGLLSPRQLAALADVVPRVPCAAIVPAVADRVVTWAPVPTQRLAFDVVFGPSAPPDRALNTFQCLGGYLGALHRVRLPVELVELPTYHDDRIRPADARLAAARAAARARLAEVLSADAVERRPVPAPVLTHGRFSTGVIALGSRPVVLGWREAGPGSPDLDVDTLLSELAEAAAVVPGRAGWATAAAVAFAGGYRRTSPAMPAVTAARLAERLLDRAVDHLALRAAVTGDDSAPVALLRLVRARLAEFCAPVAARLSEARTEES